MRWENLFDDLAGQLEHELDAEDTDVRGEEERLRIGRLTLRDRLVALHDASTGHGSRALRVQLVDGQPLSVNLRSVARDWVMGELVADHGRASQCLIPFASIGAVTIDTGLVELSTAPAAPIRLADRLGLTFALRDLARRRRAVELAVSWGSLHGTIDRVSRDHLDLAEHDVESPRRQSAVSSVRLVPLASVRFVRF